MTAAEKHNKMMDRVFNKYHEIERAKKDLLPTCTEYGFFLDKAQKKLKLSRDEARKNYGQFTYGQWKELLKLF